MPDFNRYHTRCILNGSNPLLNLLSPLHYFLNPSNVNMNAFVCGALRPNSWTKSRQKAFLFAIQSHLYLQLCLELSFSSSSRNLLQFVNFRKEENLTLVWEIHTETSSLWTLKVMPRNLNEIVRSWIRLLHKSLGLCNTRDLERADSMF